MLCASFLTGALHSKAERTRERKKERQRAAAAPTKGREGATARCCCSTAELQSSRKTASSSGKHWTAPGAEIALPVPRPESARYGGSTPATEYKNFLLAAKRYPRQSARGGNYGCGTLAPPNSWGPFDGASNRDVIRWPLSASIAEPEANNIAIAK